MGCEVKGGDKNLLWEKTNSKERVFMNVHVSLQFNISGFSTLSTGWNIF